MYIKNITKITYNGSRVKLFEVWKKLPNGVNVCITWSTAPASVANRDLLGHYLEQRDEAEARIGEQLAGLYA